MHASPLKLAQAINKLGHGTIRTKAGKAVFSVSVVHQPTWSSQRQFSSTPLFKLREVFPPPQDAPSIKVTPPAWRHPGYTEDQMNAIKVAHRDTKTWSDYIALSMVRLLRFGMDTATLYRHSLAVDKAVKNDPSNAAKKRSWFEMTERKWLVRFVFLESVAGVPGMVAGMVRHLHSLRRLKRDNGWIETLLEESYNERMHLMTFMKMAEPSWFMKTMILAAQGVFFNSLFISYLLSPRTVHRFVGYLEEEAVMTYTRAIADIDAGLLPKWASNSQQKNLPAPLASTPDTASTNVVPEIAVRYWNIPEGHRTMRDLLLYIRADEAKHREVNHTLANLKQKDDPNPFVSTYMTGDGKPRPGKGIENIREKGWERDEVV
ncbi:hypothetical protein MMC25_007767 [Agyrium rufum]|nr:hypothetical protein [Agyrium rufum]